MAAPLLDPAARVLLAYLFGSVIGSLVIGRLAGGVDIRTQGSGNAGGTNALRTRGKWFALGVVAIDVSKGWLATRWLPSISWADGARPTALSSLPFACGFAVILGHVYPIWYGFRGGKGAATLVGALAGLDPWLLLPVVATWFALLLTAGFVGLATIMAAAILPLAVWQLQPEPVAPWLGFGFAVALLILYTHRGNLRRMRAGTEPRARRLWLLGRIHR
jgi:glycerol-3-phosphate acyltransferase PlsY